jgi:biotin/methionine sulfoxide reductase
MAAKRTFLTMSWSLQRADHGEQPYWMLVTLAAMLGQIGRPGTGFGFGYGSFNNAGHAVRKVKWPTLPQGKNPVPDFIPVARISDLLLSPGTDFDYNGGTYRYPDIKLVYWAGGNPFHHHQDLNRFCRAWRRPEVTIVHEHFWNPLAKFADIVFPIATSVERNDFVCSRLENAIFPSHKIRAPAGLSRSDYDVFCGLAERLGALERFAEGRSEEDWLRHLYSDAVLSAGTQQVELPPFDEFWEGEGVEIAPPTCWPDLLQHFVADPRAHPLNTPSGRIEIYSSTVASFGYQDCPGHPIWLEPREWLGSSSARGQLHLLSNQPRSRLHSQLDSAPLSRSTKVNGREPARLNPMDAAARGIVDGDIIRLHNDRGECLAGAVLSSAIRRGVIQLSTGAWYDPVDLKSDAPLDAHGNPNVLTADRGTSSLSQGPSAQSCLVVVERFDGELPPLRAFDPPEIISRA